MNLFIYEYAKKRHGVKPLFTDTDIVVYETKTDDVYEDFYKDKLLFDFSNCPKDSKFLILSMRKSLVK